MRKKRSTMTRLKGANDYPVWWLRFQPYARGLGFDRLLKHREGYIDEIKKDAAEMRLKNMKLKKGTEDVGRDGGEKFDTPHRSVSDSDESSGGDMSGADSDGSSGLGSVDVESACSSTAIMARKRRSGRLNTRSTRRFGNFMT